MRDIYEVIQQKQQEMLITRMHIAGLKIAIKLCAEADDQQQPPASSEMTPMDELRAELGIEK